MTNAAARALNAVSEARSGATGPIANGERVTALGAPGRVLGYSASEDMYLVRFDDPLVRTGLNATGVPSEQMMVRGENVARLLIDAQIVIEVEID